MESYLLQSALLMLIAYFVGACLGCFLRRMLTSGEPGSSDIAANRATTISAGSATAAASAAMREAPEPVQPKIETVAQPTPPQNAKIAESARFERVLSSAPQNAGEPQTPQQPSPAATAAAAAVSATRTEQAAEPDATVSAAADSEPQLPTAGGNLGTSAIAATIAAAPADDLRRIGNIDEQTATGLNQLGYTRFKDIAAWTATDAARARNVFGDRPAREGWIEQAKMLADGKQTRRLRRLDTGAHPDPWSLPGKVPEPLHEPAPEPTPVPTPEPSPTPSLPDDLRHIGNIDDETETRLNQLGYTRFKDIAAWTATDAARARDIFGDRPAREGWIEQAKMLADRNMTNRLRRISRGPKTSPWDLPVKVSEPSVAPAPLPNDDLSRIGDIDDKTAKKLNELGFTRFADIAGWTPESVARIRSAFGDRAAREGWIEQAKILAGGKATSRLRRLAGDALQNPWDTISSQPSSTRTVTAPPATTPVAPADAPVAASSPPTAKKAGTDDLTRIAGIDVATANLLSELGITGFAQIASWIRHDIEQFDRLLGEPGRVSRQQWIEQAALLATGKETLHARQIGTRPATVPAPPGLADPQSLTTSAVAPEAAQPSQAEPASAPPPPGTIAAARGVAAPLPRGTGIDPSQLSGAPAKPLPPPAPAQHSADTAPAATQARPTRLADAIRQNVASGVAVTGAAAAASGVAGMRSVRSQLLSGETVVPPENVDDLKKIRGIGVLIEKKLNAMGIFSYEQIAHWSSADIERVSNALDFKGRIEREGWVQQARILSSGGQTEFSKRLS